VPVQNAFDVLCEYKATPNFSDDELGKNSVAIFR
jgi:hypothetical protein